MKECNVCFETKALTEFGVDKTRADGHRHWCKSCNSAKRTAQRLKNLEHYKAKERQAHQAHREDRLKRNREWAAANPEKRKAINRKWAENNRGYLAERMVAYRKANPAKHQEWVKANPETARANWAKRRSLELSADTRQITKREIIRLYAEPCFYCGSTDKAMHLDHVVPLSRGGRHAIGNLVPACYRCNQSKKDKTIMEWRVYEEKRLAKTA